MAKAKSAYATVLSNAVTPQTAPIPGREAEMKQNNAGGFTFTITPFQMLERFLILGSDQPTYYASAQKLTKENATNIRECLKLDGKKTVDMIVDISVSARAPKNDPALFALAVASTPEFGSPQTAQYALSQLSKVARIGTHLFHFAEYLDGMRGWGRSVKSAIGNWYTDRTPDQLAHQLAKYQQRDGWSTKDMVTLAHVKTTDPQKSALLAWGGFGGLDALKDAAATWTRSPKAKNSDGSPKYVLTDAEIAQRRGRYQTAYNTLTAADANKLITAFEAAKKATTASEIVKCIVDGGLTHEMIPTQFKTGSEVWEALLQKMPMTAMVRNLGTMSKVGLLKPMNAASKLVVSRLNDEAIVKKSKIHPLQVLLAQGTYETGRGMRSDASWTVVPTIVEALENTFYLAFANATPTGKSIYIGVDVSGSMGGGLPSAPSISCAKAAAAMALVVARTEKNYCIYGFATSIKDMGITAKDSLTSAMKKTHGHNFGSTDCAQAMLHAQKAGIDADAFLIITDNETYAGNIQPSQALKQYRKHIGKNDVRQIVMGMTASPFTIADPKDAYTLDVVGFDANVPALVTDFIRGSSAGITEEIE